MSAHFVQILFPKCIMRAAAIQYCKQNMDKSGLPEHQICEPQDQTLYLFSASDRYQRHGMLLLQHIDDLPDLVDHNSYIGLKTLQPTMHCSATYWKRSSALQSPETPDILPMQRTGAAALRIVMRQPMLMPQIATWRCQISWQKGSSSGFHIRTGVL